MTELERLRKHKGAPQRNWAERLGVSQAALQAWEKGKSLPNSVVAERYAELLGVTVAQLNDLLIEARAQREAMLDEQAATAEEVGA